MTPPALFAGLKFHVVALGSTSADVPRRAAVIAALKAHGGSVLSRQDAMKLGDQGDVMRLIVDPFSITDKDTNVVRAPGGATVARWRAECRAAALRFAELRRRVGAQQRGQGRAAGPRGVPDAFARRRQGAKDGEAAVHQVRLGALLRRLKARARELGALTPRRAQVHGGGGRGAARLRGGAAGHESHGRQDLGGGLSAEAHGAHHVVHEGAIRAGETTQPRPARPRARL